MATNAIAAPYTSDLISLYDIHKPEKMNQLFMTHGDQGLSYFDLIKSLGFELSVSNDKYEHYEDRWIHETFIVGAPTPKGDANATVTVTIDPQSVQVYGSTYYIYPRKRDRIQFSNGVRATVTDVTTGVISTVNLTPSRLGESIPALVTDQEIIILTNAFGEGAGQPKGAFSGTDHYQNWIEIVKETLQATGTEMTNRDWFDTWTMPDGSGGQKIVGYVMKGQIDLDYRMSLKCANTLLFEDITDNTVNADLNDDSSIINARPNTTEGLIANIRRAGQISNYTPGLFSVSKFDEIIKKLDREQCSTDMMCLLGLDLYLEIENSFLDYFKETNVNYVVGNTFKGNSELAMSVEFQSFKKGNRTFNFKQMKSFTHPKIGGATGYGYPNMGLFLPMDNRKDKSTGKSIPSIGSRYKELGPYSRKMEIFDQRGAGAGLKVIPEDIANYFIRASIGAHHIGVNRFVLLESN